MSWIQNHILELMNGGWALREKDDGGYELFMPPCFTRKVKSVTVRAMIKKRLVKYDEPNNDDNRYLYSIATPNKPVKPTGQPSLAKQSPQPDGSPAGC